MKNIFACLVHERVECVIDLIANLTYYDSESEIILYNGGKDTNLLVPILSLLPKNIYVHPDPEPQIYTREDKFVYDVIKYLLCAGSNFDLLTIVDSDQLLLQHGYSNIMAQSMSDYPQAGMFGTHGQANQQQQRFMNDFKNAHINSARANSCYYAAMAEQLPAFNEHFPQWSFFPHQAITRCCALSLLSAWESDWLQSKTIHRLTQQSVTSEILLPTLCCLLGYELRTHPTDLHYSAYHVVWTAEHVAEARLCPTALWMHPVPRDLNNAARRAISGMML